MASELRFVTLVRWSWTRRFALLLVRMMQTTEFMKSLPSVEAWNRIAVRNGLSEATIAKLTPLGSISSVQEGTILFNEGDSHSHLYFVCSGAFRLDMVTPACGVQTILSAGVGDLLAWSSLIGDRVMTATAIAIQDSVLITLQVSELRAAMDADSRLGYEVMQAVAGALSRRLLATRLQLLDLYGR